MASLDVLALWKLHQVDAKIAAIRNQAAHLDVGQRLQAEIDKIQAEEAEVGGKARSLAAEQTDLELQNKSLEDKIKKLDKELFGGKVVNPREVENYEKEIATLKKKRSVNDERILELWELVPPAKEAAQKVAARLDEAKKKLAERRKVAMQEKTTLETEFARLSKLRPEATKGIPPTLLARYEDIRKRHGGIGMAKVEKRACSACGTALPERSIAALKDDKTMTCETCHRILYFTEGVV